MNICIFYINNRAFASGKYRIRANAIRGDITIFNASLTAFDAKHYCVLSAEITVVIICGVALFIKYAAIDGDSGFVFSNESILVACSIVESLVF